MLTDIDQELFPDDCEVVEIPPHDLRIYLIQKNGSTSLRTQAQREGWAIHQAATLVNLDSIDIFFRDPLERYSSGVHTYCTHLVRSNPELDRQTCLFMSSRYAFLNRHYLPQWHWMVNLARFVNPRCVFRLHRLEELENIVKLNLKATIPPIDTDTLTFLHNNTSKLDFWFLLDNILLGHCGKSLTWSEIMDIYNSHPSKPLDIVTEGYKKVADVLRTY